MITIRVFSGFTGKEIELTKEQLYCLENSEYFYYNMNLPYHRSTVTRIYIDATEVWILHCSEKMFKMYIEDEIGNMKNEGSWKL